MSSCTNPLLAARLYKPVIGKSVIKILPRRFGVSYESLVSKFGQENLLELPCGRCPSCIQNRKKEWSVRCCLEALDHKDNCFVTLTYSDDDPEFDNKPHREHLDKFFKALRNKGYKIRYYGASERGDEFGRIHYHIILFGFFPSDAKPWIKSQKGFIQFTSKILESCWTHGFVTCSEFHPAEASYITGYVIKKFNKIDEDCFHFQSTRPGIGQAYVLRNAQKIYDTDNLVLSFGSHRFSVPRYFDKVVSEYYSMDLDDIKARRLELASISSNREMQDLGLDHRFKYLNYKSIVMKDKLTFKKRRF